MRPSFRKLRNVFCFTVLAGLVAGCAALALAAQAPASAPSTVKEGLRPQCVQPPAEYSEAQRAKCLYMTNVDSAACFYTTQLTDAAKQDWACVVTLAQHSCNEMYVPAEISCLPVAPIHKVPTGGKTADNSHTL